MCFGKPVLTYYHDTLIRINIKFGPGLLYDLIRTLQPVKGKRRYFIRMYRYNLKKLLDDKRVFERNGERKEYAAVLETAIRALLKYSADINF